MRFLLQWLNDYIHPLLTFGSSYHLQKEVLPFDVVLIIYHLQCNFFLGCDIPKHFSISQLKVLQGLHLIKRHNTWTAPVFVFLPPLFDQAPAAFHLNPHIFKSKWRFVFPFPFTHQENRRVVGFWPGHQILSNSRKNLFPIQPSLERTFIPSTLVKTPHRIKITLKVSRIIS